MTATPEHTLTIPDAFGGADHAVLVYDQGSQQFAARLRKVAKERRKWARKGNVACYRVYDADLPDFALALDAYVALDGLSSCAALDQMEVQELAKRTYLHVAEYQAPANVDPLKAEMRFEDALTLAAVVMGVPDDHVFAKVRRRDKGGSQYAENRAPFVFHTQEDGLWFEVDMNGYLDTGLFLDHRVTRQLVGRLARGKRFLNLFSYTGSATVHAAAGGAACTVTVDLSQTYLDWAKRNMAANGFGGKNHAYQKGDTMRWLKEAAAAGLKFDLVFVDPPTFSNSKSMGRATWDVQRDHAELLRRCRAVLAPGGAIVFSCNLRSFRLDVAALEAGGLAVRDISAQTIPHDFERNPKIHCCYVLQ